MKKLLFAFALLAVFILPTQAQQPKYVFYFIGDGMGVNQVLGTEMYLSELKGEIGVTPLLFTQQRKTMTWSQLTGYGYGLGVRTLLDKAASGSTGNVGEFGWGGAAGATVLVDPDLKLSVFYAHHMLNPQEDYYQPRLRNAVYNCIR